MPWIETNGASFHFELSGAGERSVVLIHEAGGSLRSWDALLPLLPDGCRVLRYDQRGFGLSERCTNISQHSMVADLAALLDALELHQPVHLIGSAIGATVALALAAEQPQRVASVVATSPVTGGIPDAAKTFLEQRAGLLEAQGMRAVADVSLQRSWPVALRQDSEAFAHYRGRFLANDPRAFAALTRAFTTVDLSDCYARINCPTLLVGCSLDVIKPPAECAQLASLLARGRFVQAESGHFIALQSPELLAASIKNFWSTL
jgi:3-oxoadipate enol-lactonase